MLPHTAPGVNATRILERSLAKLGKRRGDGETKCPKLSPPGFLTGLKRQRWEIWEGQGTSTSHE